MKSETELIEIRDILVSGRLVEDPIEMNIGEFKTLYDMLIVYNQRKVPNTIVVNVGDQAYLLFPEWSRQEIEIQGKQPITKELLLTDFVALEKGDII